MHRFRPSGLRQWPVLLLLLPLLLLSACGSDDDGGTGPGGGGDGEIPQDGSELQVVGELGLQSLAVGSEISSQVSDWADGLGPARSGEPTWDVETQAWRWTLDEVLAFDPPSRSESRGWVFSVQYLNGETPQQSPDGATGIRAQVTMQYSLGVFASENDNRTMSVTLVCDIEITGLGTSALAVEISGAGEVYADFTIDGEFSEYYTDVVSLNVQFTIPPGGCPTGDGVLAVNGTFVEWTWEGSPGYDWFITKGDRLASGTATLPCGN